MVEKHAFVGRQIELDKLQSYLKKALDGAGQISFVTGDAGSGKTTLVSEFTDFAQKKYKDLIVTYGQSDAQTGTGDPYLPFREIMEQLTGDTGGKLARVTIHQENADRLQDFLKFSIRAIGEVGPDLIGIFVPAAGLLTRIGAFLANESGIINKVKEETEKRQFLPGTGIEQSHILEQYTNVLITLAKDKPLVLVLDDLQWADSASINLLFRIGRRISNSRILIIGCYRPEEVALPRAGERHPLEKVLAEFKRYYGEIAINLDDIAETERANFVDKFLDTEPNLLSDEFSRALYKHTDGHPLFTIELLKDLQDRGDLIKDADGNWIEGPDLDWSILPVRVEGVIEERIGRLETELREVLTIASTEGEDFTAEVVARVQSLDARKLVHSLSGELEKKHHLVKAQGLRKLDSQYLSLYSFQHNLIQQYLYDQLGDAEKAYLHADVGSVLEELYGDQVDDISVQLARHYLEAGRFDKARKYLHRAGELAAMRYANDEAVEYFSRVLDLLPEEDSSERFEILKQREKIYHLQGAREAQRRDLDDLLKLSAGFDAQVQAYVLLQDAKYHESIGEFGIASEIVQKAIRLTRGCNDQQSEAAGYQLLGLLQCRLFDQESAIINLTNAMQLSREIDDRQLEGIVLNNFGFVYENLGDYVKAKDYYKQSLEIARQIGDQLLEARTLNNLGLFAKGEGNPLEAETFYENAMTILQRIGYRRGVGVLLQNIGILYAEQGDYVRTNEAFTQALQISREVDDKLSEGRLLGNLGAANAEQGDLESARSYFEQSVKVSQEIGNKHGEAHSLDNLGSVYIDLGDFSRAKTLFEQALIISREIGDPHLQSLILNSLGEYSSDVGDYSKAISLTEESLAIKRKIGKRSDEGSSINTLGLINDQLGQYDRAKAHLEESLILHRENCDRTGESLCLVFLGLISHHLDQQEIAYQHSMQAVEISKSIGSRSYQSLALIVLGHIFMAMKRLSEAESAYRGSLALRRELRQEHFTAEPRAGLARVFLAQGNLSRAMAQAEELHKFLMNRRPDGALEPLKIYYACYQVFRASEDPRALDILKVAVRLLRERGDKLGDEALQHSYLENIFDHREIMREYTRYGVE